VLAGLFGVVGRWLRWVAIRPADPQAPGGPRPARFSVLRLLRNLALSALVLLALHILWTESDNGKFYLVESSWYLPALWYPEEEVFANIPYQDAACVVRGYGVYFRSLRWLYKTFQLYQHIVDVSCRPYAEESRPADPEGGIVPD
jgi:hypothetical protein